MSAPSQTIPRRLRRAPGKTVRLRPAFLRAWSAIWLFTWKSQLTWRRMRWMPVLLLVLPFLVWKTVDSPRTWTRTQQRPAVGQSHQPTAARHPADGQARLPSERRSRPTSSR